MIGEVVVVPQGAESVRQLQNPLPSRRPPGAIVIIAVVAIVVVGAAAVVVVRKQVGRRAVRQA